MEKSAREEHLERIKHAITKMIESPGNKDCAKEFIQGYNAVYMFCTNDAEDKYVIEGGEIYRLYETILLQFLKKFSQDYTFDGFVRFIDGFRRSNERIEKMLSFLTRYFIRVNLEVLNENFQELKKLYFGRMYDVLFQNNEKKLHALLMKELEAYIDALSKEDLGAEAQAQLEKKKKMFRIFLKEYIKIAGYAKKEASVKSLCNKMAKFVIELPQAGSSQKRHKEMYKRLSTISAMFKHKERTKKILYRQLEEKLSTQDMKDFLETLVGVLFKRKLTQQLYREMASFYEFIDSTQKSKHQFLNIVLVMLREIFKTCSECTSLLNLFIFLNKHLVLMPHIHKKIKKPLELMFMRKLKEVFAGEDSEAFEQDLLSFINAHAKEGKNIAELSCMVANVPSYKTSFWKCLVHDIKKRLILEEGFVFEKKLLQAVAKRIERIKEGRMVPEEALYPKVLEYIDTKTLFQGAQLYDPSNFEELFLCIRDISISSMYFKKEQNALSLECKLLAYTRWAYPKMEMTLPCEVEELWESVNAYCKEKGRKFLLTLCPTVSMMSLEINETSITCDFVQGTILVLLGKTGQKSLEDIASALFSEVTEACTLVLRQKLESLISASLVVLDNGAFSLAQHTLPEHIDLFVPELSASVAEASGGTAQASRSAVEAFIVRTAKHSSSMHVKELFEKLHEQFASVTEQEYHMHIDALQEKGLLSTSEEIVYYVP
ncbi:hypothetical protein NECID01_0196 [Nematocida sp. AWRm77]|nr:hypothetical protein NECID01_0196 [Nematocida sp. AWRm77]